MAYSVFAVEVAFVYDDQSVARSEWRRLISTHSTSMTYAQKAQFYYAVTDLLLKESAAFERGCWDYFNNEIASDKYNEWCGGLLQEEGVRKSPSTMGGKGPYRGTDEVRYMTFTMAFLLIRNSNTDRALSTRCEIPQSHLWLRQTFISLIQGIRFFNFANIKSDVVYMIPNRDDFGFTKKDLYAEKFKYLRPIT